MAETTWCEQLHELYTVWLMDGTCKFEVQLQQLLREGASVLSSSLMWGCIAFNCLVLWVLSQVILTT